MVKGQCFGPRCGTTKSIKQIKVHCFEHEKNSNWEDDLPFSFAMCSECFFFFLERRYTVTTQRNLSVLKCFEPPKWSFPKSLSPLPGGERMFRLKIFWDSLPNVYYGAVFFSKLLLHRSRIAPANHFEKASGLYSFHSNVKNVDDNI